MPNVEQNIISDLLRGTAAVYSPEELQDKLTGAAKSGRPLRIKLGMDPSSPDIHLGHSVVLGLMRRFQNLGHKAVLIVGDYTARIGDPTGKSKTRPMLTPEEIDANARTYLEQATKVLDADPSRLELRRNSEWLGQLRFEDVIRLTSRMTVARMLERDTFEQRYKAGQPVSVHEFLYPIMQGWDSVCVQADVELGGTDQTFNNLVGRDYQQSEGQPPQVVITMPILRGLDGVEKMSKSLGNYIGIMDSPDEMFGKTMSIPDPLMQEWFTLLTNTSADEIRRLCDPAQTHPRQAKDALARAIVTRFHGEAKSQAASAEFASRFAQGNLPSDLETVRVSQSRINIVQLLRDIGFAASNSEARRLIAQHAVSVDESKVSDAQSEITIGPDGAIIRAGKRRVCRVTAE